MTEIQKPKKVRIYVDYIAGKICFIPILEDWKTLTDEEKKLAFDFLQKEEEKARREDEENKRKIIQLALDLMKYKGENHE